MAVLLYQSRGDSFDYDFLAQISKSAASVANGGNSSGASGGAVETADGSFDDGKDQLRVSQQLGGQLAQLGLQSPNRTGESGPSGVNLKGMQKLQAALQKKLLLLVRYKIVSTF